MTWKLHIDMPYIPVMLFVPVFGCWWFITYVKSFHSFLFRIWSFTVLWSGKCSSRFSSTSCWMWNLLSYNTRRSSHLSASGDLAKDYCLAVPGTLSHWINFCAVGVDQLSMSVIPYLLRCWLVPSNDVMKVLQHYSTVPSDTCIIWRSITVKTSEFAIVLIVSWLATVVSEWVTKF